mmetsp:Transcript_7378/g.15801  ORF Transcript_7378/g.15801 Transcript_7378/m.15801 type:complete len:108 (+) Transcript_7378:226-549(+)
MPKRTKCKIFLYSTWVAGRDVETPKEDMVFVCWIDLSFSDISKTPPGMHNPHKMSTVRACAMNFCSPNTPLHRFRKSVFTMRIKGHNRTKLKQHMGNPVQLKYILQS